MVIDEDTDWIAAGVWLTIPDDAEEGDYAGGAFVHGIDPFDVSTTWRAVIGNGDLRGERLLAAMPKNDDGTLSGATVSSADATLTANFGADNAHGHRFRHDQRRR